VHVTVAPVEIGLDSVVVASREQLASSVGGETVILGMKRSRYYGLDEVGARVWQLVQSPTPVAKICDALVAEYAVEPARCQSDGLRLLTELQREGLLEVSGGTAA
jgi:hypothetical protein